MSLRQLVLGSDRLCSYELNHDFPFNKAVGIELANDSLPKVNMDRMLALHSESLFLESIHPPLDEILMDELIPREIDQDVATEETVELVRDDRDADTPVLGDSRIQFSMRGRDRVLANDHLPDHLQTDCHGQRIDTAVPSPD